MKKTIFPITTTIFNANVCVESSLNKIDPTQIEFLLGHRNNLFTIINPVKVLYSLKNFLRFLREFSSTNSTSCFVIDIPNVELHRRFKFFCAKRGILFVDARENFISFYEKLATKPDVIVTLFLDERILEHVYSKTIHDQVPLIGIKRLSSNFFSTNSQILGNFDINSLTQNFLVSLIILSLQNQ
jgi:hypothetical protein